MHQAARFYTQQQPLATDAHAKVELQKVELVFLKKVTKLCGAAVANVPGILPEAQETSAPAFPKGHFRQAPDPLQSQFCIKES